MRIWLCIYKSVQFQVVMYQLTQTTITRTYWSQYKLKIVGISYYGIWIRMNYISTKPVFVSWIVFLWSSLRLAHHCPFGTQYNPCMSGCPERCDTQASTDPCNEPCVEGCECVDDYPVLGGHQCVKRENCGCIAEGVYVEVSWWGILWRSNWANLWSNELATL